MDYRNAIDLAKAGDESGFGFLYENTYKSKYYLALQYMKNEETAKDVLQDAYIKAFSNLDKIESPEAFPSWLGTVVANTAKNALAKKNPMLFSDIAAGEEDDGFEYQIEDDNIENQPELSYARQETQELVRELIDSLSEEQRMCILMFHIEGATINEIAEALNCSDNTVKSRLNYGRKNLKAKAEELQKKGYKLYSIAPLPLLLLLLRSDQTAMAMDGTLTAAGKTMVDSIFTQIPISNSTGAGSSVGAQQATREGAKAAAKTGVLHTTAGKITAVVIGICVAGGAVFYGYTQLVPKDTEPVVQEGTKPVAKEQPTPEQKEEEPSAEKEVADEDYSKLIAGNLNKDELAFVLAYGPEEIPAQGFQASEYTMLLAGLCCSSKTSGNYIADFGNDANYRYQFSVTDLNRMFFSFTDYQFTEDNDTDSQYGVDVDGEVIKFVPPTLSYEAAATITFAKYTETEMKVYFDYEKISYERGTTNNKKVATLQPIENGMYRIVKIEVAANEAPNNKPNTDPSSVTKTEADSGSVKQIYEGVLQSVQNQDAGYDFPSVPTLNGRYEYFLADMTGDGIQELIVGAVFTEDVFEFHDCRVYSCEKTKSGYQLQMIEGDAAVQGLYIPEDGNGLYKQEFSRGTGSMSIYRITIKSGTLTTGALPEQQFTMGDNSAEQFANSNSISVWQDISNLEGLNAIQ